MIPSFDDLQGDKGEWPRTKCWGRAKVVPNNILIPPYAMQTHLYVFKTCQSPLALFWSK